MRPEEAAVAWLIVSVEVLQQEAHHLKCPCRSPEFNQMQELELIQAGLHPVATQALQSVSGGLHALMSQEVV
jgi:hypothetical protein